MIKATEAKAYALTAQEIQKLEAIKREMEKQTRFAEMATATIIFCDTVLSVAIDKSSHDGDNSLTLYWGWDTNCEFSDVCRDLIEEKEKYANGDSSYTLAGDRVHFPTMMEYLVSNGYKVEKFEWSYMSYGHGCKTGVKIRIQWNP